jgi:hypothetical protein
VMLAVRCQDPNLGKMGALTPPMINYGKLEKRNGHLLYHDVLKNSHERKLVTDLKANVVAEERVEQFEFLVFGCSRIHVDLPGRTDIPACHLSSSFKIYIRLRRKDRQECLS